MDREIPDQSVCQCILLTASSISSTQFYYGDTLLGEATLPFSFLPPLSNGVKLLKGICSPGSKSFPLSVKPCFESNSFEYCKKKKNMSCMYAPYLTL